MNRRILTLILVLPAFVYLGVEVLLPFQGWDLAVVLSAAAGIFIVCLPILPLKITRTWGLTLLSTGAFLALGALFEFEGQGPDFVGGLLLVSPFLMSAWVWFPGGSTPASRILSLQFAFLEAILLIAAINALDAVGLPITALNLEVSYVQVAIDQLQGLVNVLQGASPGSLPLQNAVDPVFIGLAALAIVGVFLPLFDPQTGNGEPLPLEDALPEHPSEAVRARLALLRPEVRHALEERSLPRAPPVTGAIPGLLPLVVSALLVIGFIYAAYADSAGVLLPLMVGVTLAVLLALLVTQGKVASERARPSEQPQTEEQTPGPSERAPSPAGRLPSG